MSDRGLAGARVLVIGPKTFNYQDEIQRALVRAGATVTFISDKPSDSPFLKAAGRIRPRWMWLYADVRFSRWLDTVAPSAVDLVLVIKGECVSPRFLERLKRRYPEAEFILYLWDSLRNVEGTLRKLPFFERAYSFDSGDCHANPTLRYRPLFFLENYRGEASTQTGRGCFFIGTLHGDRPSVIARIVRNSPDVPLDYWLFIRHEFEFRARLLVDPALRGLDAARLLRNPMSQNEVREHVARHGAVLDIEHPAQVGLTMRTFEALAAGKKLVTTNRNILAHDFYDPARIAVIDRSAPAIDAAFLATPQPPLPAEFYRRYSLDGWIREILSGE